MSLRDCLVNGLHGPTDRLPTFQVQGQEPPTLAPRFQARCSKCGHTTDWDAGKLREQYRRSKNGKLEGQASGFREALEGWGFAI